MSLAKSYSYTINDTGSIHLQTTGDSEEKRNVPEQVLVPILKYNYIASPF